MRRHVTDRLETDAARRPRRNLTSNGRKEKRSRALGLRNCEAVSLEERYRCIAWKIIGPASAIISPRISFSGLLGIASFSVSDFITAR
jgi:hypothetical protein